MQKIMFNEKYGLTQAVLEGRKTMTRRIVPEGTPLGNWEETIKHSRYKVGEVVAVAQSYKDAGYHPSYIIDEFHPNIENEAGWSNKMFVKAELMPHQIRFTGLRVERLHDISDEDCLREGIIKKVLAIHTFYKLFGMDREFSYPRTAYGYLIDRISGRGTWGSNPLVFVYEFELVK
jgi:hypothetical protein